MKTFVLAVLAAILLLLAIVVGMNDEGYVVPALIVILYLGIYMALNMLIRYRSSYQLRMSQFLLSVLCRAENNKIYLRNGVEVRPGYLGAWIEFSVN